MDKYSLEAYERYPAVRLFPPLVGGLGDALLSVRQAAWAELEPQRGAYQFSTALAGPEAGRQTLLAPVLAPPAWAQGEVDYANAFIRRMGAATNGGAGFAGVLCEVRGFAPAARPALLRAFADAFENSHIILSTQDSGTIAEMRRLGLPFGLLLDASQGLLPLREQLARQNLQRVWETAPVYLLALDAPEGQAAAVQAARLWHVAAADVPGVPGGVMALRRLMLPREITAGGALPLRLWWQNVGSSPLYSPTTVRLWLRGQDGTETELPLHGFKAMRGVGDDTHNEILRLPNVAPGGYTLLVGLYGPGDEVLPLASDMPGKAGRYEAAGLTLDDTPRPGLYAAWDDYYPEGYYPLEDPKLPV